MFRRLEKNVGRDDLNSLKLDQYGALVFGPAGDTCREPGSDDKPLPSRQGTGLLGLPPNDNALLLFSESPESVCHLRKW